MPLGGQSAVCGKDCNRAVSRVMYGLRYVWVPKCIGPYLDDRVPKLRGERNGAFCLTRAAPRTPQV